LLPIGRLSESVRTVREVDDIGLSTDRLAHVLRGQCSGITSQQPSVGILLTNLIAAHISGMPVTDNTGPLGKCEGLSYGSASLVDFYSSEPKISHSSSST